VLQNEKAITQGKDGSSFSGLPLPCANSGLNHPLLPANGMRTCAGFPGVLHPFLFRLVTDALPWKPALGKKKKSLVQWEVEGRVSNLQLTTCAKEPNSQLIWILGLPKSKFVNLPVD
jgi:hypothetical protein